MLNGPVVLALMLGAVLWGIATSVRAFYATTKRDPDIGDKSDLFQEALENSSDEFLIQTDLFPKFFTRDDIVDDIRSAASRGVDIRILYDCRANLDQVPELKEMYENGIIQAAESDEPLHNHFWVGDGKHVRLEEPHEFQEFDSIAAKNRLNTLRIGRKYRHKFDQRWAEVTSETQKIPA